MKREYDLKKLQELLKIKTKLSLEEVEDLLSWKRNSKQNLELLKEWNSSGDIILTKKNKIKAVDGENRAKGVLNIIKNRFAFVDREDGDSIFIPKSKFNGALDGDTVIVKIDMDVSYGNKLEGEVIKIIEHHSNIIVGKIDKKDKFAFLIPMNAFGSDIYIPPQKLKNAKNGDMVALEITFWGDKDRKPEGKVVEVIGNAYDSKNMIEALIIRENMSNDFPPEVLSEARNILTEIRPEDISSRVDLRALKIITIDGEDAKDLDDAVYVEKLANGNYKLIVAIADVSHYISINSNLDKEAQKRGNSVYLVDRVLPMFPPEISNGICSLNEKEDKLTYTCELEINANAKIISAKTYKSVIHSVHRMTYTAVNKILNGDTELTNKYSDIVAMLKTMHELSQILRQEKYKRGSIDFELPEIKVILDEKGQVEDIVKRDRAEAEKIIEDFMIAANEAVARELEAAELAAVYRTHEKPAGERLHSLNETLGKFGYFIADIENITPKEFQHIIEDSAEKNLNMIVHKMILTSLKQAKYTVDNIGHFGLASNSYTHFTSPIRRYSDLTVHRLLDYLHLAKLSKEASKYRDELSLVCKHISDTERVAMKAEDESVRIKIVDYMKDKINFEYLATVVGFSSRKVFFETDEFVECSWNVVDDKHYWEFDEKDYVMRNLDKKDEFFSLGDKVRVRIDKVDMQYLEISVTVLEKIEEEI